LVSTAIRRRGRSRSRVATGKGSVTIKASDPATPSTIPCGNGSKNVAITSWFSATLHQNKPPAKLSAQIYGAIQVPNSGTASISRVKVVK